jgi:hypothetical protein
VHLTDAEMRDLHVFLSDQGLGRALMRRGHRPIVAMRGREC